MRMINEANASSSACRLWCACLVETSAPPQTDAVIIACFAGLVKLAEAAAILAESG
jgi:hypothetical protein